MKRIRGITVAILAVIIILQLSTVVFATTEIPSATSDFYVNDFAEVFTSDEKKQLIERAVSLANDYNGIQVVVTTVTSLDGDTIENYALNMYNHYGIGRDDMGLLILLSTGDRKIRVEVGKAMEAYINDAKAGRFMDQYAIPYLKENKFNEGLINLQVNLIDEIVSNIEAETSISGEITSQGKDTSNFNPLTILFWLLAVLVTGGVVILIMFFIKKRKRNKEKMKDLENKLKQANNSYEKMKEEKDLIIEEQKREANRKEQEFQRAIANKEYELVNRYTSDIRLLETEKERLESSLSESQENFLTLKDELSTLKDRYSRITTIYPSADGEVDKMIEEEIKQKDMAAAQIVDEAISKALLLCADKNNVYAFGEVNLSYSRLTEIQKSYVKNDITAVQNLYEESAKLKREYEKKVEEENNRNEANKASKIITAILATVTVGKAANLGRLKEAKRAHQGLSRGAQNYFDNALIQKVNTLLRDAEVDYEEQQRIETLKKSAEDAGEKIKRKISYCYGRASELNDLESAMNIYKRLSSDEKKYFDNSILTKLKDLIEKAKRDKRRKQQEEEERRRKNSSYGGFGGTSGFGGSSGFGSSSGFRGFGGRSGGGGSSRGF